MIGHIPNYTFAIKPGAGIAPAAPNLPARRVIVLYTDVYLGSPHVHHGTAGALFRVIADRVHTRAAGSLSTARQEEARAGDHLRWPGRRPPACWAAVDGGRGPILRPFNLVIAQGFSASVKTFIERARAMCPGPHLPLRGLSHVQRRRTHPGLFTGEMPARRRQPDPPVAAVSSPPG